MAAPATTDTNSTGRPIKSRRAWRWAVLLLILFLIMIALIFTILVPRPDSRAGWELAAITRGGVRKTITATGKTQAVVTVQVVTQVSGRKHPVLRILSGNCWK